MYRFLFILITYQISLLTLSAQTKFTALEQQKISIETPGLFEQSDAFTVDFALLRQDEYSFPLPVGKAEMGKDYGVEISSKEGDVVKAMFDGVVRMSWDHPKYGKVIVIRHDNGLETVYARNVENRVKVGDEVRAGQTIAMIGGDGDRSFCEFAMMVNGARVNPEMVLDLKSHRLLQKTILCQKVGFRVKVTTVDPDPWDNRSLSKKDASKALTPLDPFGGGSKFTLNLSSISDKDWCYPLPGAKVISPYGPRGGCILAWI